MPRLSPLVHTLLVSVLSTACQTTVNLTQGSATLSGSSTGDSTDGTTDPKTTDDCADGSEGCPCYGNGTCNDKLLCNVENLCEQPPGDSTSTTSNDTTGTSTDGTTGKTTDGTTGDSTSETTSGTTDGIGTTDGTTGNTSDDTTGGSDPDCGDVPADMACIPAATFEMGTNLNTIHDAQIYPYEKPAHMVTISKTYWMDKTEVTVEDYAVCWAVKVCELPMQGMGFNWGVAEKEKHPVNGVNWHQAKKYCEWKGKRLPTEAEWELAARGTDGRMYPWGNDKPTCEHIVPNTCGTFGTQAVGSKPLGASPYGLLDMAGNVTEWCSDYYKDDYYYESPAVDPQGPANGTERTARSFEIPRATFRTGFMPFLQDVNPTITGFRCAQTPP